MSLMKLENVRLIIPTYNRATYLRRQLAYYASFDVRLPITVADSSDEAVFAENARTIAGMPELAITHERIPSDINAHYKFGLARTHVQEEFSIMCADDDFIFLPSLAPALSFLQSHPEYAQVHGSYIAFHADSERKVFSWQPLYRHRSIENDRPDARLTAHAANYYPTLFSLARTRAVNAAYAAMTEHSVDPILWGELMPSFLLPLFGKAKVLDVLWSIRDGRSSGKDSWPTSDQYRAEGKYDAAYAQMRAAAIPLIMEKCMLSTEESGSVLDSAVRTYTERLSVAQHTRPSRTAAVIERVRVRSRKELMRFRYGKEIETLRTLVLQ